MRAAVAADGRSLRGTLRADGRCVHLIFAARGDGIMLVQQSNEIVAFRPLLTPLDLAGRWCPFTRLVTQADHAKFLGEARSAA